MSLSEMTIERYEAKTIIRVSTPSLFSWAEVYLNPYQGCFHDCKYCDGKSESYYMHADFDKHIRVKINAAILLEQFLKKKGFVAINREKTSTLSDYLQTERDSTQINQAAKFVFHIGGGVCDVYQPAENEVMITRQLLQIAYDYAFPVFILTKSKNALRDIDLLEKINKDSYACVSFTITLADEATQRIFEPRASTTQERFAAIKTLRGRGIHSGVYFNPVLPFIGDTDENMQAIYKQAKDAGAEFVYCWGLTLKPGRNKQEFMHTMEQHFQTLLPKYKTLYSNDDRYGDLDVGEFRKMELVWPEVKGYTLGYEAGLPYAARRYIPRGRLEANLRASEVLRKAAFIQSSILKNSWPETRKLTQAAIFLDNFQQDISRMNAEQIGRLPVGREASQYILEVAKENTSRRLEELEEEAYAHARNRLQASQKGS